MINNNPSQFLSFEILAEWFQAQGCEVFTTQSSNWVVAGPRILQSFPYDIEVQPDCLELVDLFKESKAIALRYSTPLAKSEGQISYHVILEGNEFSLKNLPKKVRHDILRGQDFCEYRQISLSDMEVQGWALREETLSRQGRQGSETRKWWSRLCKSAQGLPGFEMWGAIKDDKLLATIFTFVENGTASILYQQSRTEYLKYGINNTLTYTFVNSVFQSKKASTIFYGLHSLDAPPSVDEFKFRMGFSAKPVRQRVVFNPLIEPLINNSSYLALQTIQNLFPGFHILLKAEGILRFYLQGKKPLEKQNWPEALQNQRENILYSLR